MIKKTRVALTFQKAQSLAGQLLVSQGTENTEHHHSPATLTAAGDVVSLVATGSYMDQAGDTVLQPKLPGLSPVPRAQILETPDHSLLQIPSVLCTPWTCSCSRAKPHGYTSSAISHGDITGKTRAQS